MARQPSGRRRLIWGGLALATVAALAVVLRPRPLAVDAAEVTRGALRVMVEEEGETRLKRRFLVSAPVPGRVLRIDARPGDPVVAGRTSLATITPAASALLDPRTRATTEARVRTVEAYVGRARTEAQRLRIEAAHAATEAARLKALFESGYSSKGEYELADTRLRAAAEGVAAAEFSVRAAEFDLAEANAALASGDKAATGAPVVVTSPINGVVLRRLHESEAVVAAGTPLIEVGNLADLEIVADLLSADAVAVRPGAAVFVDRWGGAHELAGRVQRVEPSGFTKISALGVEEQRVNVIIDFDDAPDVRGSLGDGFRVEVRIVTWEGLDVVKAPASSLFRIDGRWAAFVVRDGRLERREITVGQRTDREAEVLSGLAPGDRVVIYPGESLTPGARVVVNR